MNKLGKHGMSVPAENAYPIQIAISENGVNDETFQIYNRAQWEEFILADRKAYALNKPADKLSLSKLHDNLADHATWQASFADRPKDILVFRFTGHRVNYELTLMA